MCPPGHEGGRGLVSRGPPPYGSPRKCRCVACGGRGQEVAVPSDGWAVVSAIIVGVFGGDGAGVDP